MTLRCIRPLTLALALTVALAVGVSTAASQPTTLVPGNGSVAGRGYGQWVVAAWRWRLSQPGVTANRTSCLMAGQRGPVWFLIGNPTHASAITTTCAIPADRYVMLFVPGAECSTVDTAPFHATTDLGLIRCAKTEFQWRNDGWETVKLDGVTLQPGAYHGGTAVFAFKMPASNNWLGLSGRTHGRMAVYGDASILRPLSVGTHTLVVTNGFRHPSAVGQITYELAVG